MKKFKYFGVVIHPKGGEKINWIDLDKKQISKTLFDLNFPPPKELGLALTDLSVKGDRKPKSRWPKPDAPEYYYGKVDQVFGQLELGAGNNRPHYQLWLQMKPQVPRAALINALSKRLYNEENSPAISVLTLAVDNDRMIDYCQKAERANLEGDYSHVQIDNSFTEYQKYLEDNPEAKKS